MNHTIKTASIVILITAFGFAIGMDRASEAEYEEFLKELDGQEFDPAEENACLQELRLLTIGLEDPARQPEDKFKRKAVEELGETPVLKSLKTTIKQTSQPKIKPIVPRNKIAFAEQQLLSAQQTAQELEKQYNRALAALEANSIYQLASERDNMLALLEEKENIFISIQAQIEKYAVYKANVKSMIQRSEQEIHALEQQIANENQKEQIEQIQQKLDDKKHVHHNQLNEAEYAECELQKQINEEWLAREEYEQVKAQISRIRDDITFLLTSPAKNTLYARLCDTFQQAEKHYSHAMQKCAQYKALQEAFKQKENLQNNVIAPTKFRATKEVPFRDLCPNIVSVSPGISNRLGFARSQTQKSNPSSI